MLPTFCTLYSENDLHFVAYILGIMRSYSTLSSLRNIFMKPTWFTLSSFSYVINTLLPLNFPSCKGVEIVSKKLYLNLWRCRWRRCQCLHWSTCPRRRTLRGPWGRYYHKTSRSSPWCPESQKWTKSCF